MKRTFLLTTLSAALLVTLPVAAAAEQRREVDVKIDARVKVNKVDVNAKLRVNIPQSISREIREALREVSAGIADLSLELRYLDDMDHQNRGQDRDWRASADDKQTRTISIGANGTLELENFSGDITVVAGGKDVSIDFIRSSHGRTETDARAGLERVRPEVDVVGTRATVRATYMDRPTSYSVSTDFVVRAPAGTRIVVNSLRAAVHVTGIKGELKITTASGDVILTDVGAVQEAKTGNGDVTIKGSTSDGELDAGTLNGDITLTDIKARRINANTVNGSVNAHDVVCASASLSTISGDVIYMGSLAKGGRYEFTSNSGDVRFSPTGSTGYALQVTSFMGEISSAITLSGNENGRSLTNQRGPRRRAATAKVGDGSATVTLQTFTGDISIGRKQ